MLNKAEILIALFLFSFIGCKNTPKKAFIYEPKKIDVVYKPEDTVTLKYNPILLNKLPGFEHKPKHRPNEQIIGQSTLLASLPESSPDKSLVTRSILIIVLSLFGLFIFVLKERLRKGQESLRRKRWPKRST